MTAACLMVKKSVFEEVGGLTEELAVAFNDVDFCLKVRAAGIICGGLRAVCGDAPLRVQVPAVWRIYRRRKVARFQP